MQVKESWNFNILGCNVQESLRKKCSYLELFWSAFPRSRTKYREIQIISSYSVRMRKNARQNNSEYGHFSRSEFCQMWGIIKHSFNLHFR